MNDNFLWLLIILFGAVFSVALLVKIAMWLNDFQKEMKYLNNEIRRTDGEERRYWISRKHRLWLSVIPFVRY